MNHSTNCTLLAVSFLIQDELVSKRRNISVLRHIHKELLSSTRAFITDIILLAIKNNKTFLLEKVKYEFC